MEARGGRRGGVREFRYWTRNKLDILAGYLSAFNQASYLRASERLYIDLMAGEPTNRDKDTGEEFDGSARLGLQASPPFTRLAFCEWPVKAAVLEADLRHRHPTRDFQVYPGDCNQTIDRVLADLAPWRWAPTFVFVDQQAAEIHWQTLIKLAAFRTGERKAELWILMSPAEIIRGVTGSNGATFSARVDALYGSSTWRRIQDARWRDSITAEEYRDEMVNLLRWQLEQDLRYSMTARIPMNMTNNMPLYDMVFATDHPVGNKIMTHLYQNAARREPGMIQEAKARAKRQREDRAGMVPMFEMEPPEATVESIAWEPSPSWDPSTAPWW
jgi:three-Cys-motif partner protein